MSITSFFTTVEKAIEAFFSVANTAPSVVAQSANQIVSAAAPVIDSLAGEGTAAKVTGDISQTAEQASKFVQKYGVAAESAAELVQGLTTMLTSNAAQAAASGTVQPIQTPAGTAPAAGTDTVSGATSAT